MANELNLNVVAAEFIKYHIDSFVEAAKGIIKMAADKLRLRLSRTYRLYITCILDRYSKAKSFFIRTERVPLYSFYVPLGVKCGKQKVEEPTIGDITEIARFSVITGSAGSGKSMFMRHLLMSSVLIKDKVPIFIELRQFNSSKQSLRDAIISTLRLNHFALDEKYIERALRAGHFVLLLDGFDEVGESARVRLGTDIRELAKKYDKNAFLVSSRPDNEFAGWSEFAVFEILPLTLDQAHELVSRLPYDEDLKTKFLHDLQRELFGKHESFLSNPLLLSIMLLTYAESANIPTKLSVFYNQAYEALFQRHDALKAGFQRPRRCRLDIQDFARVFSAFSLLTYDKREFQFSRLQAIVKLEKAKNITHLTFSSEEYLDDALQAVCLLLEDGLFVVFAHRSFQEYFTARFIADADPSVQQKLLQKYSGNLGSDGVTRLLHEMRPDVVEQHFILPFLREFRGSIGAKKSIGITHFVRYLKNCFCTINLGPDGISADVSGRDSLRVFSTLLFTLSLVGAIVGWRGFSKSQEGVKYILKKHLGGAAHRKIETCRLTYRDPLVSDMAARLPGVFSLKTLKLLPEIERALEQKSKEADTSLEELLQA